MGQTQEIQGLEVLGHDEIMALAGLVPDKEVLAMSPGYSLPMLHRLGHRESRGMLMPGIGDPKAVKGLINALFPFFHVS